MRQRYKLNFYAPDDDLKKCCDKLAKKIQSKLSPTDQKIFQLDYGYPFADPFPTLKKMLFDKYYSSYLTKEDYKDILQEIYRIDPNLYFIISVQRSINEKNRNEACNYFDNLMKAYHNEELPKLEKDFLLELIFSFAKELIYESDFKYTYHNNSFASAVKFLKFVAEENKNAVDLLFELGFLSLRDDKNGSIRQIFRDCIEPAATYGNFLAFHYQKAAAFFGLESHYLRTYILNITDINSPHVLFTRLRYYPAMRHQSQDNLLNMAFLYQSQIEMILSTSQATYLYDVFNNFLLLTELYLKEYQQLGIWDKFWGTSQDLLDNLALFVIFSYAEIKKYLQHALEKKETLLEGKRLLENALNHNQINQLKERLNTLVNRNLKLLNQFVERESITHELIVADVLRETLSTQNYLQTDFVSSKLKKEAQLVFWLNSLLNGSSSVTSLILNYFDPFLAHELTATRPYSNYLPSQSSFQFFSDAIRLQRFVERSRKGFLEESKNENKELKGP